jgi:hypothetical protein
MQGARFAVQPYAVPVENAVRRVGILLHLKNHQPGPNCMNTPARQKHRVAWLHSNAMKTFGYFARFDLSFELLACHSASQPDKQLSPRRGIRDIPHLRFRFTMEFRCFGWRRVDLQREFLLCVENFYEQGEPPMFCLRQSQQISLIGLDQPMKVLPRERTIRDQANIPGTIAYFPRFPDWNIRRQSFAV